MFFINGVQDKDTDDNNVLMSFLIILPIIKCSVPYLLQIILKVFFRVIIKFSPTYIICKIYINKNDKDLIISKYIFMFVFINIIYV